MKKVRSVDFRLLRDIQRISEQFQIDVNQLTLELTSTLKHGSTTLLHHACQENRSELVTELISYRRNLHEIKDHDDKTALYLALDAGHIDIIDKFADLFSSYTADQIYDYTLTNQTCDFGLLDRLLKDNLQTKETIFRQIINKLLVTKNNHHKNGLGLPFSLNQLFSYALSCTPTIFDLQPIYNGKSIEHATRETVKNALSKGHARERHEHNAHIGTRTQNKSKDFSRFSQTNDLEKTACTIYQAINLTYGEVNNLFQPEGVNQLWVNAYNSQQNPSQDIMETRGNTIYLSIFNVEWGHLWATYSQNLKQDTKEIGTYGYPFYVNHVVMIMSLEKTQCKKNTTIVNQKLRIITCYPVIDCQSQLTPSILFCQRGKENNKDTECRRSPMTVAITTFNP